MLPIWDQVLFLCVVAFGCYIQAVTGFALGLIVIALSALFGIMSIELASIVVTVITLSNASVALWQSGCQVRWSRIIPLVIASAPTIYLGLLLLNEMNDASQELLRILLGVTIVGCSLMLVFNPKPLAKESSLVTFGMLGFTSGILGGLFAAYGPPLIFQFYRNGASGVVVLTHDGFSDFVVGAHRISCSRGCNADASLITGGLSIARHIDLYAVGREASTAAE